MRVVILSLECKQGDHAACQSHAESARNCDCECHNNPQPESEVGDDQD